MEAIAVSSSIARDRVDSRVHFQMPFRENSGHPDTGFKKPCYACVNSVIEIPVIESDELGVDLEIKAKHDGYFLPTAYFTELMARRNAFKISQKTSRLHGK